MDGSFSEGYAIGRDSGNNNGNNGAWGGDWAWWIVILLIFGWGNGGFGNNGFGGGNGGGGQMTGYELGKLATTNDVASGFNNSAVLSSLNDLKLGQAGVQQSLCQGFNGVNTAILQSANSTERGFAQLGFDLSNCCCQTQRAIDGVNYNMAKNTCDITNTINTSTRDIIDSQRAGTGAILDFLTQSRISELQTRLAQAEGQLSQAQQTNNIVNALRSPAPIPAYTVPNPYAASCNCGCGCNY